MTNIARDETGFLCLLSDTWLKCSAKRVPMCRVRKPADSDARSAEPGRGTNMQGQRPDFNRD
jgi:hypothetical protein